MYTDKRHDNYFPCRKEICMWEHVWSGIKQGILSKEEETINEIRRLTGVIQKMSNIKMTDPS